MVSLTHTALSKCSCAQCPGGKRRMQALPHNHTARAIPRCVFPPWLQVKDLPTSALCMPGWWQTV